MKIKTSKKIELCPVSAIREMNILAHNTPNSVSLGQGVPSVPTPKYICDAVISLLQNEKKIGLYAPQPGMPALREGIATWLSGTYKKAKLVSENILVTVGGMEGLFATFTALLNPGDEVLLFDPNYASHIEQVILAGGKPVYIPLLFNDNWSFDPKTIVKKICKKTKALVTCNPSNPTGKVFTKAEIDSLVALAKKYKFVIIADETYAFLTYGKKNISLLEYPEIFDQLIVCTSFSKQFAMTGWRVGYVASSAKTIESIAKVHDAMVISAPTLSQYAALEALKDPENPAVLEVVSKLNEQRKLMMSELDTVPDLFEYIVPDGAYYMFVKFKKTKLTSRNFCLKLLKEAGVVAIPGRAFGPSGEGYVRLSFAAPGENIKEAFKRIRKWNQIIN
ncbi:MAG: pyridoxal phosphate-dependent aminotransferase [Candidatus Pacebacteria bacterium]|nr:pyridoxal phosphate-dependent aminotransferase [Candidatus Paceibacterota bacterium]